MATEAQAMNKKKRLDKKIMSPATPRLLTALSFLGASIGFSLVPPAKAEADMMGQIGGIKGESKDDKRSTTKRFQSNQNKLPNLNTSPILQKTPHK